MTAYHRIAPDLIAALASGGGGPIALAALTAAQLSKNALLLHGVVRSAATTDHPQASLASHGYELLAQVQREDRDAVAAVLQHPSVAAWAYRTLIALRGGPALAGATPAGVAGIAAAAAIRAGFAAEIDVPVTTGLVMLPSAGAAGPFPGTIAAIRDRLVTGGDVAVCLPADYQDAAPGWQPLRSLPGGLVVDDIDPFRMPAAPHTARRIDLTTWIPVFRAARTLLERHHPEVAAEVSAMISVIVPLTSPAAGQVSSSSPETFGAIAMSDPVDALSLAVTLTHEVQHVKLSALLDLIQLTHPDGDARFYAPWREDPRPASGLLQGTYAYLGVAGFWRHQRGLDLARNGLDPYVEFTRWREAAAHGAATLLSSGQLTAAGTGFVHGMAATLAVWQDEPVPAPAREQASAANARHLSTWQAMHRHSV